jgi:hypothetical protein
MDQAPSTTAAHPTSARDVNLEVFINKKLLQIYNEASPKLTDHQQLRQQCKALIGTVPGSSVHWLAAHTYNA